MVIKLMEGDPEVSQSLEGMLPNEVWKEIRKVLIAHEDSLHAVVGGRYDWIEMVTRASISRFKRGQVLMTDRIDHILTRPVFGIPILLAVFGIVFGLTYAIGFPAQKWLEGLLSSFSQWLGPFFGGTPFWVKGLIIDGAIGGAGSVLTFLPILLIFFATMSFLEDIGYMSRAAFVMDRFMHLIGLHGKSFIPMCLGFGCNVPAVLGARILESRNARLLTIFLMPFIPCTARLAVLTFISAAIFPEHAAFIAWLVVSVNIILLGITGIFINKIIMKDEVMPFIMELPLYHSPHPKTIMNVVKFRTVAFIKRAGTVILAISILIWLLSNFPGGTTESSYLAMFGKLIAPIGAWIGLDWKMIVALLTGLVAKENVIATLGVLYNVGDEGLRSVLPTVMQPASGLAFLVVMMLFIPCAATIASMRQEMKDSKWFLLALITMLVISFLGGYAAYHLALWLNL
jgi:ferrous iron transport protein B